MRIGIFGGSFDPVHNGHLELARACQAQAALDAVWFTPAARQPLKSAGPQASAEDRCAMLEGAIAAGVAPGAGSPARWRVCRQEVDRGGTSYTVDTLRTIHAEHPQAELFLLMGDDALADLPSWREPEEICRLATPLVVGRASDVLPLLPGERLREFRWQAIEMPAVAINSTEIRRLVAAGESIAVLVPPDVATYIAEHGLYQPGIAAPG